MNDPELFDLSVALTTRDVTKVLSEYINSMSWKTGDRVLDVGCGPGRVTTQVLLPRLPADFGLLVGADLSADMIQYASKTYTHPKLRFTQFDLVQDIENTSELRPSDFDKIFSFFCLHWIIDQRYCLVKKTRIPFLIHFYYVLLNNIFTVLTHTLKLFSTFRGNIAPPKRRQLFTSQHGVTSTRIRSSSQLQISHQARFFEIFLSCVRTMSKER